MNAIISLNLEFKVGQESESAEVPARIRVARDAHHDTMTVTIKKNCDLNGNNCKVEITYFHLGCNLSLPILCSSYSSTRYLFLIHFVPTDQP